MSENGAPSANVFLTKSFWAPVSAMVASKIVLAAQPWLEITAQVEDVIAVVVTAAIIAIVRRVTNRPAHFVKPKE